MRKPLGPRWGAKNDERRHHSCFLSNHLAEFQSKFEKSPASIMKVLDIMSIFTYLLWVAEINHDSLVFFHCATFGKTAKCFDVHLQVSAKIASEKYMRHIEEILKVAPAPFINVMMNLVYVSWRWYHEMDESWFIVFSTYLCFIILVFQAYKCNKDLNSYFLLTNSLISMLA